MGGKTRDGASISSIERLNVVTLDKWELLDCVFEVPKEHDNF